MPLPGANATKTKEGDEELWDQKSFQSVSIPLAKMKDAMPNTTAPKVPDGKEPPGGPTCGSTLQPDMKSNQTRIIFTAPNPYKAGTRYFIQKP